MPTTSHDDGADERTADRWARWVLRNRFGGGDPELLARGMPVLLGFRDNVLGRALIEAGDTVLDVGCGDGLLGIEALKRIGDDGTVVFCDISDELLSQCRQAAIALERERQCRFVRTGLPDLPDLASESADVVVIRSVLMYVDDRPGSFSSLYRVLRPGGRLSLFEPINRFGYPEPADHLWGFDIGDLIALADRVKREYRRHLPENNPITSFDERDLLADAEAAGFDDLRIEYSAEVSGGRVDTTWDALTRSAPNPLVPPLGKILDHALTGPEQARLAARIQDQIRAGRRRYRLATVYLSGRR